LPHGSLLICAPAARLTIQPQRRGTITEVVSGVGSIVFHIRLPGAGDTYAVQVYIVLLIGNMTLDIKDDLLARFSVLRPSLLLEHDRELGVVDMTTVTWLVWRIQPIQYCIRVPGVADWS